MAWAGVRCKRFEWLSDQGTAPRSDLGRRLDVSFVCSDDSSVRDVPGQPIVGNHKRRTAFAGQALDILDRDANQPPASVSIQSTPMECVTRGEQSVMR